MKATLKSLFTLTASDSEYFNDEQEKFELVSCPFNEEHCKELRGAVNKDYRESQLYRRNKEYPKALDLLNRAYNNTFELTKPSCANCAVFFRNSIVESMTNIKKEQQKRSGGLFNIKLPELGFLKLDKVLKEV